jgi:hypothetical protein
VRPVVLFVASTSALAASIGLLVLTHPAGGVRGPARIQVTALEYEYRLSRLRVPEGRVLVELANFGEDEHDLALRRIGGTRTYAVPRTPPDRRRTRELRLVPGRYRLWCRLGDHRVRGMWASLRVTAR